MVRRKVNFQSLSKILKNKTRRRIIAEIFENNNISYVDLMNRVDITNTGKFNYHLKVLGDLISKNQNGSYFLSEKGQLAIKLLQKYDGMPSKKVSIPDGITNFNTRALSLFPGFIWFLLVYPLTGITLAWVLVFSESTFAFENHLVLPFLLLSVIVISGFLLFTFATFPIIEIESDGVSLKWGFNQRYFDLDEVSLDSEGHVIRLGNGWNTFGWYIPFKGEELLNLLGREVKEFCSKPFFLLFLIPQIVTFFVLIGTRAVYGLLTPELLALFFGITTGISITLFTFTSGGLFQIGKMQRGNSSIFLGFITGVIISLINLLL